jgi:hypothetical protein
VTEYTLSALPPIGSFIGVQPVTLLTGIEDDPSGGLRVYLGARYKGLYMLVEDAAEKDIFRRAWSSGAPHTWMWPLPPAEAIHREPRATAPDPAEVSS